MGSAESTAIEKASTTPAWGWSPAEGAVVDGQLQPSAVVTGTIGAGTSAVACTDRLRSAAAVSNFEEPTVALAQKTSWLEEADSILSKAARVQRLGNILAEFH